MIYLVQAKAPGGPIAHIPDERSFGVLCQRPRQHLDLREWDTSLSGTPRRFCQQCQRVMGRLNAEALNR